MGDTPSFAQFREEQPNDAEWRIEYDNHDNRETAIAFFAYMAEYHDSDASTVRI
jgi:hypothetical protein